MQSIAHIRESDRKIQTVEEHLLEVMKLAEKYGAKLHVRHIAGLAGLLHDLGKYTHRFVEYILAATDSNSATKPRRGEVDHSTAGGKLLFDLFHNKDHGPYKMILAEIVGNAIISHHSYLKDFCGPDWESEYLKRVKEKVTGLEEYELSKETFFENVMSEREFNDYVDRAATELEQFLQQNNPQNFELNCMFLTKFIFSMLIDADRTNTRGFEANQPDEEELDTNELFSLYYTRLMKHIVGLKDRKGENPNINLLRSRMSDLCEQFAWNPSGIYTLSIPTGGGKTLASLRYALRHAQEFDKRRIIYVLPYTTIIEQNAEEVRKILDDRDHILEHHSNVVEEDSQDEDDELQDGYVTAGQRLKLAKDNWDAPIIFTTMVQFLNVFYAKGSRNIRRLHNLSNAVIIFDEVQKVPTKCVSLFNLALNFLKECAGSSIVLCTATQPALHYVEKELHLNQEPEMITSIDDVIEAFKRVEIVDRTMEPLNTEQLAEFVLERFDDPNGINNVLVILNTKTVVKKLYNRLKEFETSIPIYHLSTSMCSKHRSDRLDKVKEHLAKEEKVICVSTQLIEAGVDISFDCVIRSLAGLDSIAQAAGRCNRHGKDPLRQVYVIDHLEENLSKLPEIEDGKSIARTLLTDLRRDSSVYGGHLLSRAAMERYFESFYTEQAADLDYDIKELNRRKMTELLFGPKGDSDSYYADYRHNKGVNLPLMLANSYGTAAKYFEVIDQATTSVIVPYGEGERIITDLNGSPSIDDLTTLLRSAQQFTVNLYRHERDHLIENDGIESYFEGQVLVLHERAYNEEFGCDIENDSSMAFLGY
ncbi:CRISPR-associated helicase Cas3' [Paenibacillus aceti]|uniref:CRISPR-associated helicase/endonuclease Cas3 n=1 Tax=Paenibacillus aceti TaxID=1820010 RepID=A0ABQ1VS26_9BACL|nr:CRISPR-associated helicase Cas3' [Paenibacillus aceti]GGF93468.1 CRISPR-associated helicase/endonuclease Cas3 [Paenibacillus aceti]